jgi:signal transduction histidine kinase
LIGGGLAVALATLGAWVLAGAALRPVERMRRKAAALSGDDPAGRLPVPSTRDEISSLATTINGLLERIQQANTRQREFVADASHELRTPLAVLTTELELARRPGRTRDELAVSIRHASTEMQRLQHLADELLFLARHDDDPTRPADDATGLVEVVEEAVARRRRTVASGDVTLTVRVVADGLDDPLVDRTSFRRAVENLVDNASRYAPDGTAIDVVVVQADDEVVVSVLDEGPGFPPDFVAHAFERFRRTDDARAHSDGGAGLGLAIVQAVAHRHHGIATAENRPGGGAAVCVRIPIEARV